MARQVKTSDLKKQIQKKRSPVKATSRKIYISGCKEIGGSGGGAVGLIKKTTNKLASRGMLPEPDKSTSANDNAFSLLSSIGIGIVDQNASHRTTVLGVEKAGPSQIMSTTFSLLQIETDETIIPNDKIFDLRSVNKQMLGPECVMASDKFPNPVENPFFTPDEQLTDIERAKKQQPNKGINESNVINIANSLVNMQIELPTSFMLPEFKIAFSKDI
jgi:hypothetical protein